MTDSQYGNIIKCTLENELNSKQADESQAVKAILDNCGVAFPAGSQEEILSILKTDDYMGWRVCTFSDAQHYANEGVAAIGINSDHTVVIAPEGNEETYDLQKAVALPVASIALTDRLDMQFFAYRAATTTSTPGGGGALFPHGNYKSYFASHLNIDTDGVGDSHGNKDHQTSTSYMNGKLNADIHNYVVFPKNSTQLSAMLGCACVVVGPGGQYKFGIVGDAGPDKSDPTSRNYVDEASWHMITELGYPPKNSDDRPEGTFRTIIFPDTKRSSWNVNTLNKDAENAARAYYY